MRKGPMHRSSLIESGKTDPASSNKCHLVELALRPARLAGTTLMGKHLSGTSNRGGQIRFVQRKGRVGYTDHLGLGG